MPHHEASERLRNLILLVIVVVASLIAIATIAAALIHPYISPRATPDILENWGGLIIGFYFGSFASILKDWIVPKPNGGDDA